MATYTGGRGRDREVPTEADASVTDSVLRPGDADYTGTEKRAVSLRVVTVNGKTEAPSLTLWKWPY